MNTIKAASGVYLDKAISILRDLGIPMPAEQSEAPIASLISKISDLDEVKALSVARTLQQASYFNEVVRDHVDAMNYSDRYEKITSYFDSIREDAKSMVDQLEDGKVDWKEKISQTWMNVTRGDIPSRFQKIRKTYLEVAKDSREQLDRESAIIEAYKDFRVALKESEITAHQIFKLATDALENKNQILIGASKAVDDYTGTDAEVKARLELSRDQALRELQDEDKRYQISKDLSENLTVSYATGEVVIARLMQTTSVKERVYQQAVTFFSTNETVFTALNAAFTSMAGLHESTQTLNSMKEGVNKSLETLSEIGDDVQLAGIEAGYGPTLAVSSVQKLVDAVVNYQKKQREMITEMRAQSTQNAKEIAQAVENGKQQLLALERSTL